MRKIVLSAFVFLGVIGIHAQQKDTLGVHLPDADELHIQATEDKLPAVTADSYMRVSLDRQVNADEWTLIVLPSVLDGYYFGPDAERYKVTACDLTASPIQLKREKMADLDDFAADQMYLVKSVADMDKIVSLVPGAATKVPASDVTLMCLEIDEFADATGIGEVKSEELKAKSYDIAGRLAKSVKHGIYIVNGKKIFAK